MPIIQTDVSASPQVEAGKSYLVPFILVTSLFFLWGIANVFNTALMSQFQPVFTISRAVAYLVETAFYLGYFLVALPAGIFMEKRSYKKGILFGLLLFAAGALMFVPAAKLMMFPFFLLALFIIASGLAFLETAANPYVTILGNPSTAVRRLNFSQSFNGLALVVGPIIYAHFIFSGNEGVLATMEQKQQAADAVVFPYLMICVTVLLVALLFFLTKMPEPARGAELRFDKAIFKKRHLMLAVLTQFCYVGAQAGIWGITIDFVVHQIPGTSKEAASKIFMVAAFALFVFGRFLGTWLMGMIKGQTLLVVYGAIAALFCMGAVFAEGEYAVYSVIAISFFMSIMFPTIFALGVRNLGEYTKLGSSFIIMAIVGGAILPPVMGWIADNISMQTAFILPACCFVVVFFYGWSGYKEKHA